MTLLQGFWLIVVASLIWAIFTLYVIVRDFFED